MARYLVERYLPASAAVELEADALRLRSHAGSGTQLLLTLYAAEDETCFHLLDADSVAAVRRASRHAGLRIDRIVRVKTVG